MNKALTLPDRLSSSESAITIGVEFVDDDGRLLVVAFPPDFNKYNCCN